MAACGGGGSGAPADAKPDAAPVSCAHHVTLFLNAAGGTYVSGTDDDSRTNTTTLLPASAVMPAYPNADFADVKACITAGLAGFSVDVTDVDPGTAPHVELVFTTVVPNAAQSPGIASVRCAAKGQENAIAIVAGSVGTGANYHCGVALGLYGLVNNLSYTLDPNDFMSFNVCAGGAGACSFANRREMCGFNAPNKCQCTNSSTETPAIELASSLPCQ